MMCFLLQTYPADKFYNTFGVKSNDDGQTVIYVYTEYRLKPAFLSGVMKGKLTRGNRDAIIVNKH